MSDARLQWGESARWDDRRGVLYVVDCATRELHWATERGEITGTIPMPSTPTGVVLTDTGDLVVCLDDGLNIVEPESGTVELLAAYPDAMGGRANDAAGDTFGHIITGTLNLSPGPGSLWSFDVDEGWRKLADDVGNVNGPAVVASPGWPTLFCGDTTTGVVNAWDYDPAAGSATGRRVVADYNRFGGAPDGSAVDADGGVWSCVVGAATLARLTVDGVDRTVSVPMTNPSDLAFGGTALSEAFVTSIALDIGRGDPGEGAGTIHRVVDLGVVGRPEPRVRTT